MAQHFWWSHFSSTNGSKAQKFVARILTILESCFVVSFPDEVGPISVREIASSIHHFGI